MAGIDLERFGGLENRRGEGKGGKGREGRGGYNEPTVTVSPTSIRKAGEACAAKFLWRFSYRSAARLHRLNGELACGHIVGRMRTIFRNEMKIISSDNDRSCHLGRNDTASEDTTTNGDFADERALLV